MWDILAFLSNLAVQNIDKHLFYSYVMIVEDWLQCLIHCSQKLELSKLDIFSSGRISDTI